MALRHLRFDQIAPGRDFHAALAADFPRRADVLLHTHDFSEAMYVLDGAGTHALNGADRALRAGDLLWIRPQDRHGFFVPPGRKMHFINIAFRQSLWADFRRLALDAPGASPCAASGGNCCRCSRRPPPSLAPRPLGRRDRPGWPAPASPCTPRTPCGRASRAWSRCAGSARPTSPAP